MDKAIIIELVKGLLQLSFAYMHQAGLDEGEKAVLLQSERERFQKNIQTPLPDV